LCYITHGADNNRFQYEVNTASRSGDSLFGVRYSRQTQQTSPLSALEQNRSGTFSLDPRPPDADHVFLNRQGHPLTRYDIHAMVAIDKSNNIHVGGLNGDGGGASLGTINVYNTSGANVWNTSVALNTGGDNVFTQVLLDNKGSVWVMDNILQEALSPIVAKYTEH
jgi:hypothetical protein